MATVDTTPVVQFTSEPPKDLPRVGTRDRSVPWYTPNIEPSSLSVPARQLLEKYSHIPPSEIEKHVSEIRDQAWEIFPYPCIGGFRFLALYQGPHYSPVLQRLLNDPSTRFLDIGCCFGQEIRRLVSDGAPPEQLVGVDLRKEFFELGYKLFRDKNTLKTVFVAADIFDESETTGLKNLEGKLDIIYAGSFLHLFGWEQQVAVARRLIQLWKQQKGSLVYGRQAGSIYPGERPKRFQDPGKENMWVHDVESFRRMWNLAAEKESTKVRIEAELIDTGGEGKGWRQEGSKRLEFAVFREE